MKKPRRKISGCALRQSQPPNYIPMRAGRSGSFAPMSVTDWVSPDIP